MIFDRETDPTNPKFKGYCFITYRHKDEAERAIRKMDGSIVKQKLLSVRYSGLAHFERDKK